MLKKIAQRLKASHQRLRRAYAANLSPTQDNFWARVDYYWFDHAILRTFWTNFFEVAPGVYRSNQPTERRLEDFKKMGGKSVLNLRGEDSYAHFLYELWACEKLDLTLVSRKLWARDAPAREAILAAIDAFKTLPKPLLFHCKSGADRAGFTAAMYLMVCEGRPVADAKKQLGLRYIHLDFTATGVLDYILAVYEARVEQHPIDFEDWIRREYNQKLLQQGFNMRRPLSETLDLIAQSP